MHNDHARTTFNIVSCEPVQEQKYRNCMIFPSEFDKNHLDIQVYNIYIEIYIYIELCRTDLFYLFILQTKSRMLKQSTW